jgi:iron complex outermembrane receptor protein
MPRFEPSHGLSAAALAAVLAGAPQAIAQETLPTIDIGAERASQSAGGGQSVTQTTAGPVVGYKALTSVSATKTRTPIANTPATVNVVTREMMNDIAAYRLSDVIQYTPGVSTAQGWGGTVDQTTIRGFATFETLRSGMPFSSQGLNGPRDLANVERVEVLKGPAAMLFGRLEPGGAINYVMKEPLATPSTTLKQTIGSYDLYRSELDTTGPLFGDVDYRVTAAWENTNSFRDFVDSNRIFVSPVVVANISPATKLKFELEYLKGHNVLDWGIPGVQWGSTPGAPASVGRNRFYGEPRANNNWFEETLITASGEHKFSEAFTLRSQFAWQKAVTSFGDAAHNGPLDASRTIMTRFQSSVQGRATDRFYGTVNLETKLNTGPAEHTLLLGYDRNAVMTFQNWYGGNGTTAVNIYAPTYGSWVPRAAVARTDVEEHWWGVYLQDQIRIAKMGVVPGELFLTPGVRYDDATQADIGIREGVALWNLSTANQAVSFRVGALWRIAPDVALFANYVEGLGRANLATVAGIRRAYSPEFGKQIEVGMRVDVLDGLLTTTGTLFEVTRQNIATVDPFDPSSQRMTGEAVNKGVEIETIGKLTDTTNITAGYTFIDSHVTKDNTPGLVGKRYQNVANLNGTLFVTQDVSALIPGLTIGGGVVARSSAFADLDNTIELPAYATVDLLAKYKFKIEEVGMEAQINVKNLLNTTYYPNANWSNAITVGAPISVFGSLRATF